MSATAPLVAGHALDSIVTWIGGRPLTAAQFCGAASAVAAALATSRHAINLCDDAPRFMLASAAAWLRGQTIILPPDRLPRTLEWMRRDFPHAYCLCDSDDAVANATRCGFASVRIDRPDDVREAWPPPALPLDHEAACLHTSGTTGEPSRHMKTWRELIGGAAMLAHALGTPGAGTGVVGTVAPQHMFGFETTVLFPLQAGARVLPLRPALPADLADATRAARALGIERIWLFTTPLQLRAFHAAERVSGVERVVTAAMPLEQALAERVEREWMARVDEIYGCTEGGTLAFRRPTRDNVFAGGHGVCFVVDAAGAASAICDHLSRPVPLADRIELGDRTAGASPTMRLLGRDDDLVKVAGKRASLAGLTASLRAIDGVVDAAFFLASDDAARVCAVAVAPALGQADVQRELALRIDPAFMPRPLLLVDAIPRGASFKTPVSLLRELVAARTPAAPASLTTRACFAHDDPVFPGHFPGRPIVPGVLLIERVEAALATRGLQVVEVKSCKFHAVVAPDEPLDITVECRNGNAEARFRITRQDTLVASGVCGVAEVVA